MGLIAPGISFLLIVVLVVFFYPW